MQQLRLKENLLSFHHSDRTHSWFGASLPTQIYGYGRIISSFLVLDIYHLNHSYIEYILSSFNAEYMSLVSQK
ncbi:hypothetical protein [Fischerella thermalis]|uniref:Uncharacterized protein n=1 Tax=Fischerella thermalis JSC-11 TaxID=741277 RepID=G6FU50_9CYAN|nr:hypothetical protein [Fischerella thermalis]EHC12780.1 hypothetical protein FJSC11DRAFT_2397 [Fischerella thermalis JSC-11]